MVNRRLKTCGGTKVLVGTINCMRMIPTMSAARMKKIKAVPMYISPNFLWSTVTTHSCRRAVNGREVSATGDSAIS